MSQMQPQPLVINAIAQPQGYTTTSGIYNDGQPGLDLSLEYNTLIPNTWIFTYGGFIAIVDDPIDSFNIDPAFGSTAEVQFSRFSLYLGYGEDRVKIAECTLPTPFIGSTSQVQIGSLNPLTFRVDFEWWQLGSFMDSLPGVQYIGSTGDDTIDMSLMEVPTFLDGGDGNDSLYGAFHNKNVILGGAGNDTIHGYGNGDQLYGDDGDDYVSDLDGAGDLYGNVFRNKDFLYGGNGNDNVVSMGGNDRLYGGAGNDSLSAVDGAYFEGGAGNDTITGDTAAFDVARFGSVFARFTLTPGSPAGTWVVNGEGSDVLYHMDIGVFRDGIYDFRSGAFTATLPGAVIFGTDSAETLSYRTTPDGEPRATSRSDVMFGLGGNDRLEGLGGIDFMFGGAGDDIYVVENSADRADESTAEGTDAGGNDTVLASVNFTLGNFVENLVLTGTAAINGTGNALDNRITGNAGANTVDGGGGNDVMSGGLGDDTMYGGAGDDTMSGGDGVDYLDGGAGIDRLNGGAGADIIRGGAGNDTLTGGIDADTFVFEAAGLTNGIDRVTDFVVGLDRINVFAGDYVGLGIGMLDAARFTAGTAAVGAGSQFVYNAANGVLAWDGDGAGGAGAVAIARLTAGTALTADSIWVV